MWGRRTYLDWAAAAPVSAAASIAFGKALGAFGNPSAVHAEGRAAKGILEDARTVIARLAEVKTDGVVFTSGATEANALAILGAVQNGHVLYQSSQHASVMGAIRMLKERGVEVEVLSDIEKQLRTDTVLVTMDAVNSETGERFNTRAVRRTLDAKGNKTLLHVDASQLPLAEAFTLAHLGADMVSLDAQKVGGVRGIGVLLMRQGITLTPLMRGGGQERGRRPGTENPALATAFAAALTEAEKRRETFVKNAMRQRTKLIDAIRSIQNIEVNEGQMKVPHILNVSFIGRDTDYLVALLDTKGFAVSTKSACESDSEEGSRAVLAMTGDDGRARSTLRISWGPSTSDRDLEKFSEALIHAVRFLDENAI